MLLTPCQFSNFPREHININIHVHKGNPRGKNPMKMLQVTFVDKKKQNSYFDYHTQHFLECIGEPQAEKPTSHNSLLRPLLGTFHIH